MTQLTINQAVRYGQNIDRIVSNLRRLDSRHTDDDRRMNLSVKLPAGYREKMGTLLSGHKRPDDTDAMVEEVEATLSAGPAFWITFYTDPTALDNERCNESMMTRLVCEWLGLSYEDAVFLGNPVEDEAIRHARPSHLAEVLRRYADTGVISWRDVVEKCESVDCGPCGVARSAEAKFKKAIGA